jgi:Fe-S-cluster containining protein
LKQKPGDFVGKYLHLDSDGHYVLNHSPCPFLGTDNYCSIYSVRPQACREYPHTDRKNINQIMDLTYQNTMVCPAVASIVEKLKVDFVKKNKL